MVGIDPGPTAHGFPNHDQLCNNEEPKKPFWTFRLEFKTLISGETHPAMVTRVRITGRLMLSDCWGFKIRNNVKAAWGNAKSQMMLEENIQLPKIA